MLREGLGKDYENVLVLGTGGGNDIVSAVLIAMYLQKEGFKTDVAGMLSPAAVHSFNGCLEKAVNEINGEVKRVIPYKTPKGISFIDSHLPEIAASADVEIGRFYDFSTRFGTAALVECVKELIKDKGYDLVVGVDVGGDILARGGQDSTLLSPMMDFSALYLLGKLDVDAVLVEFGYGTDGELRPKGMKEILAGLKEKNLLLHEAKINGSDAEVAKFKTIFGDIRKIRYPHATYMTLQTLESDKDVVSEYRFRSHIGKKKWNTPFKVVLPKEYSGKVFMIDAKGLAAQRQPTAFAYDNVLQQYVKLKKTPTWKTEADLLYLWSGNDWKSAKQEGYCMQLLVPSKLIPEQTRQEIIQEGVAMLERNDTDVALVLTDDLKYIPDSLCQTYAEGFHILSRKNLSMFLADLWRKVAIYQK